MMTKRVALSYSLLLAVVHACTDILVTPGASKDGAAMIAYNADAPQLFGYLYHYPSTPQGGSKAPLNATRKIYDWDSGVYLGEIPEVVESTYNVVGNGNERGLVIGETTFGGVPLLAWNQTGAVMDYGSLIYVTLQRAQTAREAIAVMSTLMDTHGYYSGGESFSIADSITGEVWMMEVISRGSDYARKGAVWVAVRIPDGAVGSHANHARITQFPRDDPENCIFAEDVVDVAVFYGLYPAEADPMDFSFSDVYDPLSFLSVRQGEARVWSIFSQIADTDGSFAKQYQAYALGEDLSVRMPLYVMPYRKLSLPDVTHLMSNHYEGTVLDSSVDVGAGLFESPYRPRPLEWEYEGVRYHNERSVATPKTGWNFIAQLRPWMPPPLAVVIWFACDDSSTAPRTPVYTSSTRLSPAYYGRGPQDGVVSPIMTFDSTKAFWVQNQVSNFVYFRYADAYPVLQEKLDALQNDLMAKVAIVDQRALQAYHDHGPDKAVDFVTLFTVNAGNMVHRVWQEFYGQLFVQFRDFYTILPSPENPACGCQADEPGLSNAMKKRIVEETGEHYRVIEENIGTGGNAGKDSPKSLLGERGRPTSLQEIASATRNAAVLLN